MKKSEQNRMEKEFERLTQHNRNLTAGLHEANNRIADLKHKLRKAQEANLAHERRIRDLGAELQEAREALEAAEEESRPDPVASVPMRRVPRGGRR